MDQGQFVRVVAELVAGLQVPVSISGKPEILGRGGEPWQKLIAIDTHGFGWTTADKMEAAFRQELGMKPKVAEREPPEDERDFPDSCGGSCQDSGKWGATGILPSGHAWQWRDKEHTSGYLAHV